MVRSSLGKPLISPRLLCLFDGQLCMRSQFLIWQHTLGPRVTINFTFNCQQVLITGITRALNVGFLLIFLPVGEKRKKQGNRPRDTYRPSLNRNILWSLKSHFHHFQIWRRSREAKNKPQFQWMWTITMGFFFRLQPPQHTHTQMWDRSFSKSLQRSCYLLSREVS